MIVNVPLDAIYPNPYQTRLVDGETVRDLAEDILANGLLQAPVGRLIIDGKPPFDKHVYQLDNFGAIKANGHVVVELAFGHRRWTAFRMLASDPAYAGRGIDSMPIRLDDLTDVQMADLAWSENEQRKQHTPIERSLAIKHRMEKFGWNQHEIADHMRLSRPVITNALRLLDLPEAIQGNIQDGQLSERQAMALLGLFGLPEELRKTAEGGWNGNTKPSAIVSMALEGASSDAVRQKVDELIGFYSRVITWPVGHEFYKPADSASIRCSDCQYLLQRGQKQHCLLVSCWDGKSAAWAAENKPAPAPTAPARPAPEPAYIRPDTTRYSNPAQPAVEVVDENDDAPQVEQPEAPPEPETTTELMPPAPAAAKTWASTTVVLTLTFQPEDGNQDGRMVLVAARAGQAVGMKVFREHQVLLEGPLADMILNLKAQFGE